MPQASSPLNHSVTGLGLELIPHCPMRAHGCQESAEPNSTPWGTHEEVPTPNGGNPSYHRVGSAYTLKRLPKLLAIEGPTGAVQKQVGPRVRHPTILTKGEQEMAKSM